MSRRTKDVLIETEGRDKGKLFRITEMPAWKAEEWAMKALIALQNGGLEIGNPGAGMAGIAQAGFESLRHLKFGEVKPLLDEMFECIEMVPDKKNLMFTRPLVDDDTMEVATRLQLRAEVFTLHTGFSFADARSKSTSAAPSATF